MSFSLKAGLAAAGLAVAASAPVVAADLNGYRGGSIKDGPAPIAVSSAAGPCYVRGDVGYSFSQSPNAKWPVTSRTDTFNATDVNDRSTYNLVNRDYQFVGDKVSHGKLEDAWFGDIGIGCGSGSRGLRADVTLGVHATRKFDGVPPNYTITEVVNQVPVTPTPQVDPIHTSLRSYTAMVNGYYDLGSYSGFVPYVGAGIGVAYHRMSDVYFTGNPLLTNRIRGANDLSFAWSLMAGVGYQVSDRAILDVGYRYLDLGKAQSERVDNAGFVNPRFTIKDIESHEIKVGLRYHFGGGASYDHAPLK